MLYSPQTSSQVTAVAEGINRFSNRGTLEHERHTSAVHSTSVTTGTWTENQLPQAEAGDMYDSVAASVDVRKASGKPSKNTSQLRLYAHMWLQQWVHPGLNWHPGC